MVLSATAHADCAQSKSLLEGSKQQCAIDQSYCDDVASYQADVTRDCGPQKKSASNKPAGHKQANVEGSGKPKPGSVQSKNSSVSSGKMASRPKDKPAEPLSPDELPKSCAYFTKPPVDEDGAHLNYHQLGAMICYRGYMYECTESVGGGKQWIQRATCSTYQNSDNNKAEKVENSRYDNYQVNQPDGGGGKSQQGSTSPGEPDGEAGN